jgi:hypothetical protein
MTTSILNARPTIQGGNATTRQGTTNQVPPATTREDLRTATQNLRDAIRHNVDAEMAAQARASAQVGPIPPTPPDPPGQIVVRGADGTAQTISLPAFRFGNNEIPQQAVDISVAFFLTMAAIIIGLPLARAFARRMDRRGGTGQIPTEITSQLAQLNQAVDAIALEVERISEGQRFTTRLLTENREAKLPR